jgi:Glucose / Sorbosone dehydrogenase
MRRLAATLIVAAALLATASTASAAPALVPIAGSWSAPIYAASPPRDPSRLFVVQREGLIRVVVNGTVRTTPFADLTGEVGLDGERGLLSIAFPPDYQTSGLAYVYLAAPHGELQIRELRRSAANPDVSDGTQRIVWRQAHDEAANHNGGTLAFGPDGMLWFATGDGGGGDDVFAHAQDLGSQLGKVLRIDPRTGTGYRVPAGNPYGNAIWAAGLRNPFRFSFDRVSGDLFIGDVGQVTREEIDWVRFADGLGRAGNYGWACFEGFGPGPKRCNPPNYIPPIHDYSQGSPRAVTGGVLVRDPGLPTLVGRYIYADSFHPDIRSLVPGRPATGDASTGLSRDNVVAFAEDACGHVYVVSIDPGSVERIQDGAPGACVLMPGPRPLPGTEGPPAGGTPPPATPAADTTPPVLRVSVTGRKSLAKRRRVRVAVHSSEPVAVRITGRLRGVARFRTARRQLPASKRVVVTVRITRKTARKLRRALHRKRVIAVLRIAARDAVGNQRRVARRVKVPRRP